LGKISRREGVFLSEDGMTTSLDICLVLVDFVGGTATRVDLAYTEAEQRQCHLNYFVGTQQ
jgi:hypothetical protein